jgi:hypothetical protein
MDDEGFFLTPTMGRQNVVRNSGCVTWALSNRRILFIYVQNHLFKSECHWPNKPLKLGRLSSECFSNIGDLNTHLHINKNLLLIIYVLSIPS